MRNLKLQLKGFAKKPFVICSLKKQGIFFFEPFIYVYDMELFAEVE